MTLDDHLFGIFWEGEIPAREAHVGFDTYDAWKAGLIDRVRERFRPSPLELRTRAWREQARHRAAQAKVPARRAAEAVLGRTRG